MARAATRRFRFPQALQHAGSGSGKSTVSTAALVPSLCSIGTILPSRPARSHCRRAQRRSRMARLRVTASAARSVLDGCEHDGMLDRVGAAISDNQTIKSTPQKAIKKRADAYSGEHHPEAEERNAQDP